jgi:hypothetical protein
MPERGLDESEVGVKDGLSTATTGEIAMSLLVLSDSTVNPC